MKGMGSGRREGKFSQEDGPLKFGKLVWNWSVVNLLHQSGLLDKRVKGM